MEHLQQSPVDQGRRSFLVRVVAAVQGAIAATLAFVVGGAAIGPSMQRRESAWWRAASLDALSDDEPVTVTIRIARQDGYAQVVDRTVLYLMRGAGDEVQALHSTCTHLGCRTSYDRTSKRILCPCHGGAYDRAGNVVDGPPPAPLPRVNTRVEDGQVFVEI